MATTLMTTLTSYFSTLASSSFCSAVNSTSFSSNGETMAKRPGESDEGHWDIGREQGAGHAPNSWLLIYSP